MRSSSFRKLTSGLSLGAPLEGRLPEGFFRMGVFVSGAQPLKRGSYNGSVATSMDAKSFKAHESAVV